MSNSSNIRVSMAALVVFFFLLFQGAFSPAWSDPMTIVLPQFQRTVAAENAHSRISLLTDRSFVNLEIREIGRNPQGALQVEYRVTLENVTTTSLPDGPGRELVLYLPAGVQVEPGTVSATLGSVTVVGSEGQATTVEWDVELAGATTSKARRGVAKTTSTSSGTVTVKVTIPDLPIQGSALVVE